MDPNQPVSEIMSTRVVTAHLGQRPSEARRLLMQHGVHHLPVVRGDKLVGLISSADMYKLSMASYGADERAVDAFLDHQFSLEDIMQTRLVTLDWKAPIRRAAELLQDGNFHSLPVVDPTGRLVGMVTTTDLVRFLLTQYDEVRAAG